MTPTIRMRSAFPGVVVSALLACGLVSSLAHADAITGTLFYTTFSGGVNVHKVDYNYNGTTFALTNNVGIASTSGADGLLFAPDGNLLVAGQGFNLTEVTTGGTIVKTVNPGGPSFHLALNSNASDALVYNMWNGGGGAQISAVTLSGGGLLNNGVAYTVSCSVATPGCSTDVRGVILDTVTNIWYYGTAPDGGLGDFGTVVFNDTLHTATLTRLQTNLAAHGLSFDPFSNDVIINSANLIEQVDGAGNMLSFLTGSGNFDQAAVDGKGHLFVASNGGGLLFADYDSTGLIGSATFTAEPFLAASLDDIAPLSGLGGNTVPEPSTLMLLMLGAGAALRFRRAA